MNASDERVVARRLLEALAETNRLFRDHAVALRRSPGVASAQASLEVCSYESGPVVEGYVDATLANGDGICWCLDVRWDERCWTIEATLDRRSGDRQKTIAELPVERASEVDEFVSTLKRVVAELLSLSIPEFKERN